MVTNEDQVSQGITQMLLDAASGGHFGGHSAPVMLGHVILGIEACKYCSSSTLSLLFSLSYERGPRSQCVVLPL